MEILILSCRLGMGHLAASRALRRQIEQEASVNVREVDIYDLLLPGCGSMLAKSYGKLVAATPSLYNAACHAATESNAAHPALSNSFIRFGVSRLSAWLSAHPADAIIATYSLSARLAALWKRQRNSSLPLITCITDVDAHHVWLNRGTDLYLVAAPSTRQQLLEQGVPAANIALTGVPVRPGFYPDPACRQNNSLLLMGGGLGMLPESGEFYRALDQAADVETTVVCGRNQTLFRKLERSCPHLKVLGFVADPAPLMREASLLVSKPGGVTSFEAIQSQTPFLLLPPEMKQEKHNCDFLLDGKMGRLLPAEERKMAPAILTLLRDREQLAAMSVAMRDFRRQLEPEAATRFLAELAASRRAA